MSIIGMWLTDGIVACMTDSVLCVSSPNWHNGKSATIYAGITSCTCCLNIHDFDEVSQKMVNVMKVAVSPNATF